MGEERINGVSTDDQPTSRSTGGTGGTSREIIELSADELYGDVDRLIERVDGRNDGSDGGGVGDSGSRTKRANTRTSTRSTATKRRTTAKKSDSTSLKGIEALLLSIHNMAAHSFKAKEFSLTSDEAEKITEALAAVSSHYEIDFDPKLVAWTYFTGALVSVYAPKVVAYKVRVNLEVKAKAKQLEIERSQGGLTNATIT